MKPILFFRVERTGQASEVVTRAGLGCIFSTPKRALISKYTQLKKKDFPGDPSKWKIILRPSGTVVTLLTPEAATVELLPKKKVESVSI